MPVYMCFYFFKLIALCFRCESYNTCCPNRLQSSICKDKKTPLHIECNGFNLFLNNVNVKFNESLFNSKFIFQFLGKSIFVDHDRSRFVGNERIRSIQITFVVAVFTP